MSQPAPPAGLHAKGRLNLQIIARHLQQTLSLLPAGSDEFKDAMSAMKALMPYGGGQDSAPLQKSEISSLGAQAPTLPAVTPQQRAALQKLIAPLLKRQAAPGM